MGDDWKGEGLIRKSVTKSESKSEVRRLVSKIYHNERRAAGIPVPAAKSHSGLMRAALADIRKR
jgi:hypothetical protein